MSGLFWNGFIVLKIIPSIGTQNYVKSCFQTELHPRPTTKTHKAQIQTLKCNKLSCFGIKLCVHRGLYHVLSYPYIQSVISEYQWHPRSISWTQIDIWLIKACFPPRHPRSPSGIHPRATSIPTGFFFETLSGSESSRIQGFSTTSLGPFQNNFLQLNNNKMLR